MFVAMMIFFVSIIIMAASWAFMAIIAVARLVEKALKE